MDPHSVDNKPTDSEQNMNTSPITAAPSLQRSHSLNVDLSSIIDGPLGAGSKRKDETPREDDTVKRPSVPLSINLIQTPSAEVQKALMNVPCVSKWIRNNYNHNYNQALLAFEKERKEWKTKEQNYNFAKVCDHDLRQLAEKKLDDTRRQLNLASEAYNKIREEYDEVLRKSMLCTCDAFGFNSNSNMPQTSTGPMTHGPPPAYEVGGAIHQTTGTAAAMPDKKMPCNAGPYDSDGDWNRIKFLNNQCESNLRLHAKTKQDIKAQIALVNAIRYAVVAQAGVRDQAIKAYEALTEFAQQYGTAGRSDHTLRVF